MQAYLNKNTATSKAIILPNRIHFRAYTGRYIQHINGITSHKNANEHEQYLCIYSACLFPIVDTFFFTLE